MTQHDAISPCRRCQGRVYHITTDGPGPRRNLDIDAAPLSGPHTRPYFEHPEHGVWIERHTPEPLMGGPVHQVHHCPPPARCRHCEQVHISSSTSERTAS